MNKTMETKDFKYLFGSNEENESTSSFDSSTDIYTFYVHIVKKPKKYQKKYKIFSKDTLCIWRILMANCVFEEMEHKLKEILIDELSKNFDIYEDINFIFHNSVYDKSDWEQFVEEINQFNLVAPLKKISINESGELFIYNL